MTMDPRVYDTGTDINQEVRKAREAGATILGGSTPAGSGDPELLAAKLAEAIQFGRIAMVSPVHKNTKFLIKTGKLMACMAGSDVPAIPGVNQPTEIRRVGDIAIKFEGGICILDPDNVEGDIERLDWCLQHEDVVRNAMDPRVEEWTSMKEGQTNLSTREPTLNPGVDVDAVMRGDYSSFNQAASLASRARQILAGV